MAVTFVGATNGSTGSATATSLATSFHGSWAAGDVAILSTHYGGNSITVNSGMGDWTAIDGVTNPQTQGTASRANFWFRVLQGGDGAPTIGYSGSITGGWTMTIHRGVASGDPIGQSGVASASATSVNISSLTGVLNGSALVVHLHGRVASGTIPNGWTPPGTYTEPTSGDHATNRTTGNQNVRMAAAYRLISSAGNYGGDTFTVTNSITSSIVALHAELLSAAATVTGSGAAAFALTSTAAGTRTTSGTGSASFTLTATGSGTVSSPMAALVDDFDDDSIDTTKWPANYGSVAETGGRARVDCDTGQWSAYKSGSVYHLAGSHALARIYPPSGGASDGAYCSLLVTSSTAGTDAGFLIDSGAGVIGVYLRVGFSDGGALFPSYSATDHAWLRLRETAGTLYWEASPNGASWTQLRSETSPAWVSDQNLALILEAHRTSGTDNFAEYDDVNNPPAGATVNGTAAAAFALTATSVGSRTTPGAAAAGLAFTATASGARTTSGSAVAQNALTAAAVGTRATSGAAVATFTLTSAAAGARTAAGTAAAALTLTATAVGTRATPGAAAAILTLTATAIGVSPVAGSAAAVFVLTASAVGSSFGDLVPRPDTGTTTRPSVGTTARPSGATTARPGSAVTTRPFAGVTTRP